MKIYKKIPKISLVGAGPGDPELLTLKALKTIQKADVILYDALSNEAILEEAPKEALLVYVGKRAGEHSLKQSEINLLLVQYAFEYGHVVRLKGGDPFIFGRGYEELQYAEAFGIEVDIVPGISSSTSLAALQRVPVTHRGMSEGFWVLTATTQETEFASDLALAAQSNSTVVILMGMGKLNEIISLYQNYSKGDLPIMLVQNGSLPNEKIALGTIDNIATVVAEKGLGTPAVIIIGDVVSLHPQFVLESIYEQTKKY